MTTTMRERFDEKFQRKMLGETIGYDIKNQELLKDFIEQELNKEREEIEEIYDKAHAVGFRDCALKLQQEHKAELESIKGEIENSIAEPTELEDVRIYNIALKDTISILDSHINKLSTE